MKINKDKNIYIIGAGISGLIAAQNLEQKGYVPTILEAAGYIGGRVRTEIIDGWILDVGFQVLLDAYPMSKILKLCRFRFTKIVSWCSYVHR